jgi:hypothetical protein
VGVVAAAAAVFLLLSFGAAGSMSILTLLFIIDVGTSQGDSGE